VIVAGGKVGEMATHFCNKYKILILRLMSKWDLRRLCKAVSATPLPRVVSIYNGQVLLQHCLNESSINYIVWQPMYCERNFIQDSKSGKYLYSRLFVLNSY
jgi:hypothetical protein